MSKIKWAFIAIAILTAVGTAFATKPCDACDNSEQFIWTGSAYVSVGYFGYGTRYDCYVTAGVCTFYKPNPMTQPNVYAPCREGAYMPF